MSYQPLPFRARSPRDAMRVALGAALTILSAPASVAIAGDFSVSPIRADFSAGARSASITVTNDHKTDALNV